MSERPDIEAIKQFTLIPMQSTKLKFAQTQLLKLVDYITALEAEVAELRKPVAKRYVCEGCGSEIHPASIEKRHMLHQQGMICGPVVEKE